MTKPVITIIGSRQIPEWAYNALREAASYCRSQDIYVRSGGAKGADTAAQEGALEHCIVYEPWAGFSGPGPHKKIVPEFSPQLLALARKFHPAPHKLTPVALKLMARNGCQVLGLNLDSPTKGILYYAPEYNGTPQGGTSQAWRIAVAQEPKIPTMNLYGLEHLCGVSGLFNLGKGEVFPWVTFIEECITRP